MYKSRWHGLKMPLGLPQGIVTFTLTGKISPLQSRTRQVRPTVGRTCRVRTLDHDRLRPLTNVANTIP